MNIKYKRVIAVDNQIEIKLVNIIYFTFLIQKVFEPANLKTQEQTKYSRDSAQSL